MLSVTNYLWAIVQMFLVELQEKDVDYSTLYHMNCAEVWQMAEIRKMKLKKIHSFIQKSFFKMLKIL